MWGGVKCVIQVHSYVRRGEVCNKSTSLLCEEGWSVSYKYSPMWGGVKRVIKVHYKLKQPQTCQVWHLQLQMRPACSALN